MVKKKRKELGRSVFTPWSYIPPVNTLIVMQPLYFNVGLLM